MDLDVVYKQLLDGHRTWKTTLSNIKSKRKIDRSAKHVITQFAELQYCNRWSKEAFRMLILSVQQIRIRSSCCVTLLASQDNAL